jgi:hypothetical protein
MDSVKKYKVADLVQLQHSVQVGPNEVLEIRPLSLEEMVRLFLGYGEPFLVLFQAAVDRDKQSDDEVYSRFLLGSPLLVGMLIGMATDEMVGKEVEEQAALALAISRKMPAQVQLSALAEIMRVSVPDPKRGAELLSGVMALLQKFKEQEESDDSAALENSGVTTSS